MRESGGHRTLDNKPTPEGLKAVCLLLCVIGFLPAARAQELSPRAYLPTPEGTRIATLGYAFTTGDTITDPSLPITGVNSDINAILLAYKRSFDFAGRSANFIVELPYSWGETTGRTLETQRIGRNFSGMGDLATTVSVNLVGAPSMDREEFREMLADPGPMIGVSLRVVAPTGNYHDDRIVNVGGNRWAAKLEFGAMIPLVPKWVLELELGAWAFQDNDDFVTGKREQESIAAAEMHIVRLFERNVWASLDFNYYKGGRTRIDGKKLEDLQRTSKAGASLLFPMDRQRVVKVGFHWGSVTDSDERVTGVNISISQALN
jgi:hypothetical protein